MFSDDLDRLLKPYAPPVAKLARKLIKTILEIRPDFAPKVSFGWQTVNFRHPKHGFLNAIYMSKSGQVLLVFQDGRLLDSPLLTDDGKVKKVRWIPFRPGDVIPVDEIAILIAELRGVSVRTVVAEITDPVAVDVVLIAVWHVPTVVDVVELLVAIGVDGGIAVDRRIGGHHRIRAMKAEHHVTPSYDQRSEDCT